ncbi:MAG TPA: radical SAM protein [Parafilimonas sp.]|nr:radical SAM protein [Parafilimonas sp.]
MKILLTHGYFLAEDPKEQLIMRPYPPLGILYISAYLEQHNFPNEIYDSTFGSLAELKTRLENEKPDLIGIYTNLMTKLNVLKIIRFVKDSPSLQDTKIILGGPEVRNHKQKFLEYGVDVIVFGEGEETMLELVTAYAAEASPALQNIAGIAFKNADENIITNAERMLIKDINQLPFPNRNKIALQKYFDVWKKKHGISMLNVSTMRGCPYSCKWCSRAVYGSSYRRRNPKLVADEIEWLQKNYQFDKIWFVDDVFTINPRWLREFASEIQLRNISISYEIITRADRLNEEAVQLLKQSGCFRVWIGAESGSQKIIDAMDRRVKVEDVRSRIRLVKSYGMEAGTFIMLGYPGEDENDIKETLLHLKYSDPDQFTITVAYPIKGTPLYTEVENIFVKDLPWETSTDRDIDFKRRYTKRYYDYAMQWIQCEMSRQKHNQNFSGLKLTLRSFKARGGMLWERLKAGRAALQSG